MIEHDHIEKLQLPECDHCVGGGGGGGRRRRTERRG